MRPLVVTLEQEQDTLCLKQLFNVATVNQQSAREVKIWFIWHLFHSQCLIHDQIFKILVWILLHGVHISHFLMQDNNTELWILTEMLKMFISCSKWSALFNFLIWPQTQTHVPSTDLSVHCQRLRHSFKIDGVDSSHSFPLFSWIMQWRQLIRHIRLSSWEAGAQLHKSAVAEDVWQACLWRKYPHHLHLLLGFVVILGGAWTHHLGWVWG